MSNSRDSTPTPLPTLAEETTDEIPLPQETETITPFSTPTLDETYPQENQEDDIPLIPPLKPKRGSTYFNLNPLTFLKSINWSKERKEEKQAIPENNQGFISFIIKLLFFVIAEYVSEMDYSPEELCLLNHKHFMAKLINSLNEQAKRENNKSLP